MNIAGRFLGGGNRQLVVFGIVWLLTRALMLSQLGFLHPGAKVNYGEIEDYRGWSAEIIQIHAFPDNPAWQYPPGAAAVFLLPRLAPGPYEPVFIGMMLLADLVAAASLFALARRTGIYAGAWLWVLVLPTMGQFPFLRFDLVPTAIALLALAAAPRVSKWLFGGIVGLGVAVKAWPVLLLMGLPGARRSFVAAAGAAAVVILSVLIASATLGHGLAFLTHHEGRGLELEAIAATPWYFMQALTGSTVHWIGGNGSLEIVAWQADLIAQLLRIAEALVGLALLAWWILWQRRGAPGGAAAGLDAAFTALLLGVVVSAVLSPQYLIWLLAMGCAAFTSPASRLRRPIAGTIAATLLTAALLGVWGDLVQGVPRGAYFLVLRNLCLVAVAIDATAAMVRVLSEDRPSALPEIS